MATASLQLISTLSKDPMASRRVPLANVPNAVNNSPFRSAGAGKRTRAQAGDLRDPTYGQPPTKKQVVEIKSDEENVDPRRRNGIAVTEEPFMKRTSHAPSTALEKRSVAAAAAAAVPTQRVERSQRVNGDNLESIRQWQRHYRRQFPQFVFYLDGVSDDVRSKIVRQVQSLGAREEKFFSKAVTHVVTTRHIPPEAPSTSPNDAQLSHQKASLPHEQRKTANMLDSTLQRRTYELDARRVQTQAADVLTRARELGIKIWALEKLQRVLKTMLEAETGEHGATHDLRAVTAPANNKLTTKSTKDADLEQMLRNERINGPADRDMTVAAQDMCTFKGYFLYIHDMDEKTKPVMIRDYPKPQTKDQGKWPQFRLSSIGRCPFLEDPTQIKKIQQEQERQHAKAQQDLASQRRTRASTAMGDKSAQPLAEQSSNLRRSPRKSAHDGKRDLAKPLEPPKLVPSKRQQSADGMPAMFGSAQVNLRGLPRLIGGEPIASGIQHSNVTSAIRSQAVSSAAISSTAPGLNRRLTDSREVSALKRKVLERGASANSQPPSSYLNDMRAAINEEPSGPPPRAAKRKAQENLLGVVLEGEEALQAAPKQSKSAPRKRKVEKDPKPGYCENCRDKFDDFDEHINSRKHQKFARTTDNWKELDALLSQLKRPLKCH